MAQISLRVEDEVKKKAFQNMLMMRESSDYPKDFDYKKVMEEASGNIAVPLLVSLSGLRMILISGYVHFDS